MRTGLLVSAALATALVSSTALADRTNDYDNKGTSHTREIKERVLENQKEGHVATVRTETTRTTSTPNVVRQKIDHRAQGDVYDQYGKNEPKSTVVTHTATGVASKAGVPAVLQQKNGEEMADDTKNAKGSASSYSQQTKGLSAISAETTEKNYGPMGKQIAWTAGGKSVRSFTHFVNDKGQINNNPHGATATAMHARHQMMAVLAVVSAAMHGKKLFNFEGSGGDASADAAP